MARVSDEQVRHIGSHKLYAGPMAEMAWDLADARSVLRDLLTRMEDRYDGAPDAKPSLPFNGNDMEEIKQVLG